MDGQSGDRSWRGAVPPSLLIATRWAVCILVLGALVYGMALLLDRLTVMVLATFAALLGAALLHRPTVFLRRRGWPRWAATWTVLTLAAVVAGGAVYLISRHVAAEAPRLTDELSRQIQLVSHKLDQLPVVSELSWSQVLDKLQHWVSAHRSMLIGQAFTAGSVAVEFGTGVVLAVFLTYFFLAEGDRLWAWLVRLTPQRAHNAINGAGHRAWQVLSGWIVGTAIIGVIHGVVIGLVMWMLGTPLVIPLAVLVFVGTFIPIVGAFVAGGLAVLLTLVSGGPLPAAILLGVLIVENNLEGYLFQPLIVGRAVRLHPVAIVVLITCATLLVGVIGAVVVIPLSAAAHAAVKYLTRLEDIHGHSLSEVDRMAPMPPPVVANDDQS